MTNFNNTTFYIGVTNNLLRRVYEHKNKLLEGFTNKYNLNKLIYYEETFDIYEAINREKKLKKWRKDWKVELIDKFNPGWKDLAGRWFDK